MTRFVAAFSILLFFIFGMLAAGEQQHFSLQIGSRSRLISTPLSSADTQSAGKDSGFDLHRTHSVYPGPWGELEYYVFYLQNPNAEENASFFSEKMYWCFPKCTEEEVVKKLEKIGINKLLLQQNSYIVNVGKELRVVPTDRLIRALTPEIRAKLRMLLRRWPDKNPYYAYPIVIESGDPVDWYTGAGLTPETAKMIQSLCYTQRDITVLSDVPYVLIHISDLEEKDRFLRSLFRTRTLMLRLTINEQSDINAIRNYWALNNRRKEVLPIFNSIAETRGVDKLDVVHLLPPFARRQLYTFPEPDERIDCHRTSLTFAGVTPNSNEVYLKQWEDIYKTYFVLAKKDLQFGDIVVLFNQETDEPIHSMVYIAADIFYTKNGLLPYSPWVFMFWSDVLSLYGFDTGTYAKVYRRP